VIAIDDADKCLDVIRTTKRYYPHLKVVARAIDRRHAYELMRLGIDSLRRETFHSALALGVDALELLGVGASTAKRAGELFEQHDQEGMHLLSDLWGDDASYGVATRQRLEDLTRVLQLDQDVSDCWADNGCYQVWLFDG